MSELTNLTDRISHLRERKNGNQILSGERSEAPHPQRPQPKKAHPERRMATDYFMIFVYSLLGASMICQIGLILWLDL